MGTDKYKSRGKEQFMQEEVIGILQFLVHHLEFSGRHLTADPTRLPDPTRPSHEHKQIFDPPSRLFQGTSSKADCRLNALTAFMQLFKPSNCSTLSSPSYRYSKLSLSRSSRRAHYEIS